MRATSRSGLLAMAVWAVTVLNACSGDVSKRQITQAIDAELKKEKTCFTLAQKKLPSWPLRVQRPYLDEGLNPILAAMRAAGYLQVRQQREAFGYFGLIDVITPTEQAKGWWDVQTGFCVGTKAVADVQEWTEPGKQSGMPIQVKYTWHLTDVPSWAKRPEFGKIEGMVTPVPGGAILQKTNKGWTVQ